MDHRQIIESYFRAFRERDREMLRSILTPDFHHISSFGEWRNRDAMLEAIWPEVGQSWALNLRIFGDAPEFVVIYQHEFLNVDPRPRMNMAELIRFDGNLIAKIEVFVGRELTEKQND